MCVCVLCVCSVAKGGDSEGATAEEAHWPLHGNILKDPGPEHRVQKTGDKEQGEARHNLVNIFEPVGGVTEGLPKVQVVTNVAN